MIRIEINGTERHMEDARESWVNEQINRRLRENQPICVRVWVEKKPEVDLVLSTPDCPPSGGSGRGLTRRENEISELWKKRRLSEPGFTGGNLWAFLRQASRL
jgi:hypothetical protein